jgi:inhibitor of cysteine peptidase
LLPVLRSPGCCSEVKNLHRPDLKRFLLLACLAGCRPSAEGQAGGASPITLTAGDSGRTVAVAIGTDIVITLPATPGTGYSWVLVDSGAPELQLVDTGAVVHDSAQAMRPGAPTTTAWRFRAGGAGRTALTFDYRRPWEHETPAARRYEVRFEVR